MLVDFHRLPEMDAVKAANQVDHTDSVAFENDGLEFNATPGSIPLTKTMVYMDGVLEPGDVDDIDLSGFTDEEVMDLKRDLAGELVTTENLPFLSEEMCEELAERADEHSFEREELEAILELNAKARDLEGAFTDYEVSDMPELYDVPHYACTPLLAVCAGVAAVHTVAAVHAVAAVSVLTAGVAATEVKVG